MSVLEIQYDTPKGLRTAYVFTDASGRATAAHNLTELVAELDRRKRDRRSTASTSDVSDFLHLERRCRPEWESLRRDYADELRKADAAGCTKCTKASIARKYVRLLRGKREG